MNKILVSLAASLAVLGVVFAQVPGGFQGQEVPRPAGVPGGGGGRPTSGVGLAATEKFVYVLRNNTLLQYSADGLKLVAKTTLPPEERGGVDGSAGRGGGGGRRNDPPAK